MHFNYLFPWSTSCLQLKTLKRLQTKMKVATLLLLLVCFFNCYLRLALRCCVCECMWIVPEEEERLLNGCKDIETEEPARFTAILITDFMCLIYFLMPHWRNSREYFKSTLKLEELEFQQKAKKYFRAEIWSSLNWACAFILQRLLLVSISYVSYLSKY